MPDLLEPARFLDVLEGNRRLTLRTIEAFPEETLFAHAVEPMRPFAALIREVLTIELGYMRGIATGEWTLPEDFKAIARKSELLAACEATRARTREWWPGIPTAAWIRVEPDPFFDGPPQSHFEQMFYCLENEIHHRAQGYVYLRQLGIEPPAFYER